MSAGKALENYIPLPTDELIEWLCADGSMPPEARESFRAFCRLISGVFHYKYHERLEQLKVAYQLFDPDIDTRSLRQAAADEKQRHMNALFTEVAAVLEGAGYKHLSAEDLEMTLHSASAWGLRTDVDFRAFERLAI